MLGIGGKGTSMAADRQLQVWGWADGTGAAARLAVAYSGNLSKLTLRRNLFSAVPGFGVYTPETRPSGFTYRPSTTRCRAICPSLAHQQLPVICSRQFLCSLRLWRACAVPLQTACVFPASSGQRFNCGSDPDTLTRWMVSAPLFFFASSAPSDTFCHSPHSNNTGHTPPPSTSPSHPALVGHLARPHGSYFGVLIDLLAANGPRTGARARDKEAHLSAVSLLLPLSLPPRRRRYF